mmetsp:Transcript_59167/g.98165  ORF Transcript_59167/g.98165 Transcript_59167/m.98165 type:complete len:103 (+) Transcript_59167:449-757(+)
MFGLGCGQPQPRFFKPHRRTKGCRRWMRWGFAPARAMPPEVHARPLPSALFTPWHLNGQTRPSCPPYTSSGHATAMQWSAMAILSPDHAAAGAPVRLHQRRS